MGEQEEQILFSLVKEQLEANQNISALTLQLLESLSIAIQKQAREMEEKVRGMDVVFKTIQQITSLEEDESYIPEELEAHKVSDPGTDYIYPVAFYVREAIKDEDGQLTDAFLYAMKNEHGIYYWVMDADWNYVKNGFFKDMGISSYLEVEIIKEKEFDFFCDLTMLDSSFVREKILEHCDPKRFARETAYELLRKSANMAEDAPEKKDEPLMSGESEDPEQKSEAEEQKQLKESTEKKTSEAADIPKEPENNSRKKETGKVH